MSQTEIWALVEVLDGGNELLAIGFETESEAEEKAAGYHDQIEVQSFDGLDELYNEFSHQDLSWIKENEEKVRPA